MKWYSILALFTQSIIWVIVLVCMVASRYNWSCFGARRRPVGPGGGAQGGSRGLEEAEIDMYPKLSYPNSVDHEGVKMIMSRDITECVVCLGVFMEGETLRLIPMCGHVFHADCVDVWLRSHPTCPYCRANLLLPPPETIAELPV